MLQGHYRPELLPGQTQSRPDVDSSGHPPRGTSLSAIESRLHSIRSGSKVLGLEPELKAFMDGDVEYLMRIARAADRISTATNAEVHRAALGDLMASVRR
jgi:hypothetical protein